MVTATEKTTRRERTRWDALFKASEAINRFVRLDEVLELSWLPNGDKYSHQGTQVEIKGVRLVTTAW